MESDFMLLPTKQKVQVKLENSVLILAKDSVCLCCSCCGTKATYEYFTKGEITSVKTCEATSSIIVKGHKKVKLPASGLVDFHPFELTLQNWNRKIVNAWKSELDRSLSLPNSSKAQKLPNLILVNPFSGKGKSEEMCANLLLPLMAEFGLDHQTKVTTKAKEVEEFLQAFPDLAQTFASIIIVSGDGLLFEALQGLFRRSDWPSTALLPIGIVPGGTGNGLARSLAHYNKVKFSPLQSCLNVINGLTQGAKPMDVIKVTTGLGQTYYSFLSIGWGFTSDCDIDSECLRFMGDARFTMYSLKLLCEMRSYRGTVSFIRPNEEEWTTFEDDFVIIYVVSQPWVTSDIFIAPSATLSDGLMYLLMVKRSAINRYQMLQLLLGFDSAAHQFMDFAELFPIKKFKLSPISQGSYITVDGEVIENSEIQAEILPECINILTS